jgi:hypothetical protein|tara:strand:- start:48 stop:317 length:270 start_codon:yes stop_codon:yes gene_type:complete
MKHIIKFNKAILSLQPNAKFSAKGVDENNSEITDWIDDTIPQPSASEINAKIIEIENIENNKPANRASGKQKLKDLGLNDDEIQALMGV